LVGVIVRATVAHASGTMLVVLGIAAVVLLRGAGVGAARYGADAG
jgi:hypothetical protein